MQHSIAATSFASYNVTCTKGDSGSPQTVDSYKFKRVTSCYDQWLRLSEFPSLVVWWVGTSVYCTRHLQVQAIANKQARTTAASNTTEGSKLAYVNGKEQPTSNALKAVKGRKHHKALPLAEIGSPGFRSRFSNGLKP
eukprot:3536579-Amphidinium_carterae.1